MHGLQGSVAELEKIIAGANRLRDSVDILVCPPATLLTAFAAAVRGSAVAVGAQDCHAEASGAHTGDLSAEMLKDAGASAVILGHSERRQNHAESDADVQVKTQAAWRAGLMPIVCIGETKEERDAGATLSRIERQLDESFPPALNGDLVVAYEPVWAIGSGLTPTPSDVAQVHALIRDRLCARFGAVGEAARILYGGSVKPSNAKELMAVENVDGALVGGASLKADEFLGIVKVYGEPRVSAG
jgi:triosephosphate isomerase